MAVNSIHEDEKLLQTNKLQTMIRLFRYMLGYKKKVLFVLFIMIFIVGITLINPIIIEIAIDEHIVNKDFRGLIGLGIIAVIMNVVYIFFVKVRMYTMAKISNEILLKIRQELYIHIQTLSFNFFDSRPTGKILARIIGDVNSLKEVLENSVTTLIPDFITLAAVVVIMFIRNYKLAIAALISFPILIIGVSLIQFYSHKKWQIFRKKGSNLNAFVHEDLSGMRIIQSYTAERETEDKFDVLLEEYKDSYIQAVRLADSFGSMVDLCWGIGIAGMYFTGVKLIGREEVPIGTLIAFTTYIGMFWNPIMNLSNFYNQLVTNITGAERIFEILDTKPDIVDQNEVINIPEIAGEVIFDHVSFAYDDETRVLNNISFHIKPGETIALVGATGAGKSTIINLISRFYDIKIGNIFIDGYNIKEVSIESLRSQMGIMTQENFIFSGTIKDNIRYGKLDATDEEIIKAAKAVNAHEFIMTQEKGYDTELEERGNGLSAGQKQLVAFARTMISMPKILILDEATSSIDTHTELLVQDGIKNLLKGRTSFVIAHRLSTIQNADRIFVIDEGIIKEEGTMKELLDKKGIYYDLYMAQFGL